MAFEHRPGTFTLFKNDQKGNDKAPFYRGTGKDLSGNDIEVAAWLKEGGKGKFMSCTFKLKEAAKPEHGTKRQSHEPTGSTFDDMDSDVPF